jgi:hypothetical protein
MALFNAHFGLFFSGFYITRGGVHAESAPLETPGDDLIKPNCL